MVYQDLTIFLVVKVAYHLETVEGDHPGNLIDHLIEIHLIYLAQEDMILETLDEWTEKRFVRNLGFTIMFSLVKAVQHVQ